MDMPEVNPQSLFALIAEDRLEEVVEALQQEEAGIPKWGAGGSGLVVRKIISSGPANPPWTPSDPRRCQTGA